MYFLYRLTTRQKYVLQKVMAMAHFFQFKILWLKALWKIEIVFFSLLSAKEKEKEEIWGAGSEKCKTY
jgi:hypothetical protein